jgi:ABC-2 type transport system ATP-binding protein
LETVLSINGLAKRYGKIQAVKQLEVEIGRGDVFGILGPNGSGKSTTLGMVLDLVTPDSGSFEWFGQKPSKESRKRIGAVIETPNFYPYLSAEKNLRIVADIKGYGHGDIERVLQTVSLFERRQSKFRTFSFGMRQRLAVASAMLGNPEVLILDEPTNGLDPQGIAQMREIILKVASEGITIILASHLLDEVQKICSHVAVLSKGKRLFAGPVDTVLAVSDCIELGAADHTGLAKALAAYPNFKSLTLSDGLCLAYFKGDVRPADLNTFMHSNGIVLSHLAERKRSLEQHFLALLQENK